MSSFEALAQGLACFVSPFLLEHPGATALGACYLPQIPHAQILFLASCPIKISCKIAPTAYRHIRPTEHRFTTPSPAVDHVYGYTS